MGARHERVGAIGCGGDRQRGDQVQAKGAPAAQAQQVVERERRQHRLERAQRLPEWMRLRLDHQAFAGAPYRFAQGPHPDGDQQAGQPHCEERGLPALEAEGRQRGIGKGVLPGIDDHAAEEQANARADVNAARIDRQHRRPDLGREVVGQHRERGGRSAGLADADPEAVGRQRREAARRSRQRRHQAPEGQADGDQALARPHVGELAQRNAEHRVEDGEGRAVEKADFGIGDAEVRLDLLGEYGNDLPIDEVEHVDDQQYAQGILGIAAADLVAGGTQVTNSRADAKVGDASL